MPVTTAIYNAHTDKISSLLTDIEQQFTLDEDVLISITSHFHKLVNLGLSEYGHPMAMMYVLTVRILVLSIHVKIAVPHSSLACQMVRKLGNVYPRHASLVMYVTSGLTALSSHLISAAQICETTTLLLKHSFSPVQAGVPSGVARRQNLLVKTAKISRLRGSQDRGGNGLIRCVEFSLKGLRRFSHFDTTHSLLDLW